MATAIRGDGSSDALTRVVLGDFNTVKNALIRHLNDTHTKRNTSRLVAHEVLNDTIIAVSDLSALARVTTEIIDQRNRQETATPGRRDGKVVRRTTTHHRPT